MLYLTSRIQIWHINKYSQCIGISPATGVVIVVETEECLLVPPIQNVKSTVDRWEYIEK